MKPTAKEQARSDWMRRYQARVTSVRPELIGRMDWDTANHLYNLGLDYQAAADRFLVNHPAKKEQA